MSYTIHLFIQFILLCSIGYSYAQSTPFNPNTATVLSLPADPVAIALDSAGNLFVSVEHYYVTTGPIGILRFKGPDSALTSSSTYDLTFTKWGPSAGEVFSFPDSIILDQFDTLWVTDSVNNVICWWKNAGTRTAGGDAGPADGYIGGGGSSAQHFNGSIGINFDSAGNLWVADRINFRVVKWAGMMHSVNLGFALPTAATYCIGVNPTTVSNCLASTGTGATSGNQPIYVFSDSIGTLYVTWALGTTVPGSVEYYRSTTLSSNTPTPDGTLYLDNCPGYPNPYCLPFGITYTDLFFPYLIVSDTSNNRLAFFSHPFWPGGSAPTPIYFSGATSSGTTYTFQPISSDYSGVWPFNSNTLWVADTLGARALGFRNFFPNGGL